MYLHFRGISFNNKNYNPSLSTSYGLLSLVCLTFIKKDYTDFT